MGYYTRFSLELKNVPPPETKQEVLKRKLAECSSDEERLKVFEEVENSFKLLDEYEIIRQLREYSEGADFALEEDGSTSDGCKWYDWKKDMAEFSREFPSVLFVLNGEGEESGDIWVAYIQDGKVQRSEAKITFDEYDPSKMR